MDATPTLLARIAEALERLSPPPPPSPDWNMADAFQWSRAYGFRPVAATRALPLELLRGVDPQKSQLLANVGRFVAGRPANHVLLWGARGTGKSSLVKAVHAEIAKRQPLHLIEIARNDIGYLPDLLVRLGDERERRFLLLCDDLSFFGDDSGYQSLKSVLDGGLAGAPENVLFCVTSNRRHLLPREAIENERAASLHPGEAIDEKVSLSDRFGLWLGFHHLNQETYLGIVEGYLTHFGLGTPNGWQADALAWATGRGARSGRVAWQYLVDHAGRTGADLAL